MAFEQINEVLRHALGLNSSINVINPRGEVTHIISSMVMDWKYYTARFSLKGLLFGIKDMSIYRIIASIVGFIYLINPYVAKKIIQ